MRRPAGKTGSPRLFVGLLLVAERRGLAIVGVIFSVGIAIIIEANIVFPSALERTGEWTDRCLGRIWLSVVETRTQSGAGGMGLSQRSLTYEFFPGPLGRTGLRAYRCSRTQGLSVEIARAESRIEFMGQGVCAVAKGLGPSALGGTS